jgi:hypothetical protein
MALGGVRGLTAATAATADHAIAAVWNPSGTKRITLLEIAIFAAAAPGAGAGFYLRRMSARGTAGSTVTPIASNAYANDATPDSGWVLDLATYSVQPTLVALPGLGYGFVFAAVQASGIIIPCRGIVIPPGAGVALVNRAGIIVPASEVSVVVDD